MGSPLCLEGAGAELSRASTRNCLTSGFEAAPDPTSNYAFDVHINTGLLGANGDTLEQDYVISPIWMAIVWVVHALIVALEWCFTIDLLNGPAMGAVARALRTATALFTQPWLVMALAVASVLALYHGLIRRRVAETLGQVLLMLAMMVGGLWVIVNPTGTLGELGQLANQASLGTLGAVTEGTPAHPDRTLANSMRDVFGGVVSTPWCYMEFGNVGWCSSPARLDPRLHAAASKIATGELAKVGCKSPGASLPPSEARELGVPVCVSAGSAQGKALNQSAELLRNAHTNGELFLALPANQAARNSINESGSLFNVLCGGSHEPCKGPTAAQAEFRTQKGTQSRLGGLFLIAIGALGMILLLGFIALHLLSAAIISLFYLLLAPAAVIAPALGDGGRAAFRGWATRLLGAVTAKLLYSFMLGVVLLMERVLMNLPGFGWWTQWLLLMVLWWGAFRHRHDVLGLAPGIRQREQGHGVGGLRLASRLMAARELTRAGKWTRQKLSSGPPSAEKRQRVADAVRGHAKGIEEDQQGRTLEHERSEAHTEVARTPKTQARLAAKRAQLERVQREREKAQEGGNTRRAAELGVRAQRIEGEVAHEQQALNTARQTVAEGDRAKRAGRDLYTSDQSEQRARFLDEQAALPDSRTRRAPHGGRGSGGGEQRDYAGMAGLAGYGRKEYEGLDARRQRAARLEIDRELALRKEVSAVASDVPVGGQGSLRRRQQRKAEENFDSAVEQKISARGHALPASAKPKPSGVDAYLHDSRAQGRSRESSVMRDAREVAARRRRQLDRERGK